MSDPQPDWGDDATMRRILTTCHVVAVVGLSPQSWRDSYEIADYLQQTGYRIVPVNPSAEVILGERVFPSLRDIPFSVDLVNVFRRSEFVMEHTREAIAIGAKALWLQLHVIDEAAAQLAHDAGLDVVMDRCVKVEHQRLLGM
ncbi:MAG TPA: CoA-binding protein [Ktedonobacterales bacterium]